MFRRSALVISTWTLVTLSLASTSTLKPSSPFNGFYSGIGLGSASTTFNMNNNSSFASTGLAALTTTSSNSQQAQKQSVLGELNLGYGHTVRHNGYLGFFGFLDLANHENSNQLNKTGNNINDNKSSTTQLSDLTGGLAFQPGWQLTHQTLFYGLIGWNLAKEKINATHRVNITTAAQGSASATQDEFINGLKLGVGFEEQISQSIFIGIRYAYTYYFEKPQLNTPTTNTTGVNLTGPFSYSVGNQQITTQTVLANVTYRWNKDPFRGVSAGSVDGFNGFFVSPEIGATNPSISGSNPTTSASYLDQGAIQNTPLVTHSLLGDSAETLLSFAAGFGHVFNQRVYLGIEGAADWSNNKINNAIFHGFRPTTVAGGGQVQDSITHNSDLSFWDVEPSIEAKFGVAFLKHFLGYVKAGVAFNKVKLNTSDTLSYIDQNSNRETLRLNLHSNNNTAANLRIGAGVAFEFSQGNTFNLNYIYTYYGKIGASGTRTATDAAGNPVSVSENTQVKLSSNTLTIGYTHYFNS